jgi:hypothetical protein
LRGGHHPPWVVRVRHLGRIVLVAGARGRIAGWVAPRDAGAGLDCLEVPVGVALWMRLAR